MVALNNTHNEANKKDTTIALQTAAVLVVLRRSASASELNYMELVQDIDSPDIFNREDIGFPDGLFKEFTDALERQDQKDCRRGTIAVANTTGK